MSSLSPPNGTLDRTVAGFAGRRVSERVRAMLTGQSSWLIPAILGCVALAVRLPNLDHVAELDELYHFFAAQSWLAEGQLEIADGVYNRTALFTIFVAQWPGLLERPWSSPACPP